MPRCSAWACCLMVLLGTSCRRRGTEHVDYDRQLAPGEQALVQDAHHTLPLSRSAQQRDRICAQGIAHSLRYLTTPTAAKQYRGQIPRERVIWPALS